jgi:MraZ protein
VQQFVSTITNKLDAKGRVSIPAPYRQILASQNTAGVYCFRSFVAPALEAFGEALLAQFAERLNALDPFFSEDHDAQAQAVLSASRLLSFDDEGRVRLPDDFIAHAGITAQVSFVGMGRKFQIWNPDTYAPIAEASVERARATRSGGGS